VLHHEAKGGKCELDVMFFDLEPGVIGNLVKKTRARETTGRRATTQRLVEGLKNPL
jgi:hypothetical protein